MAATVARRADMAPLRRLRERDPGFAALRRAGRAALVMPAIFALGNRVIGDTEVAIFAVFGSFAMLLLVDFAGPMRERLLAEAALAVAGAGLVAAGTVASHSTAIAAVAMALVAFAVTFAGVVSSIVASSTTALLLAFILPVSLPGTVSAIPERLAGWGMASGAALVAVGVLWPAPARNAVRMAAIAACRALGERLSAEVAFALSRGAPPVARQRDATVERAKGAIDALDRVFFATPYGPTGLSTAARAVVRLVDELRWLDSIVVESASPGSGTAIDPPSCGVVSAAAMVLERGADLLDAPARSPSALDAALALLRQERADLERSTSVRLPGRAAAPPDGTVAPEDVISALDPSFRAQELSYLVSQIARNIDLAAAADRRSWTDQLLGRQPAGIGGTLSEAQVSAGAHLERHSLWLRNSVRAAVGLGLAVLVARLTGVQHSFWVVLGTLSVLRSNALSTGQDVLHALLGTLAGFVVGAVIVVLIGTDTTVLWVLLPPAVLLAGLAPATVSFAAGQAAFTLTLLILFNLLSPAGWQVGLVRIEDVALGTAISLAVGLLFWPRGAAAALGAALAKAYSDSATYMERAVEFATVRRDSPFPAQEARRAVAASKRLDDAFRNYLAERGAKPLSLADVASLVTGVVGLRLAGDAVLDLWQSAGAADADRLAARRELVASSRLLTRWYEDFAASLTGRAAVPEPLTHGALTDARLVDAVRHDMQSADGRATTAVRMLWTADHLDAARRLQDRLVGPARAAAPHGAQT